MYRLTANGNTPTMKWNGGAGTFRARGGGGSNFGGGTAKLQTAHLDSPTEFDDVTSMSLLLNGQLNFSLDPCFLRINLAGATTPTVDTGAYPIP